ncbi:MAG: murein hydrolase activator EnvC family protein [Trichloromonadaceae bacterium]
MPVINLLRLHLLLLCLCCCLHLTAPALGAEGGEASRKNLAEIERRIQETNKSLAEKKTKAKALATELGKVESELGTIKGRISGLAQKVSALDGDITAQEEQARRLKAEIAAQEALVRRRLAALYKGGETGLLRILFSSGSPARMAEDHDYFGRMIRRDRELIASFRQKLIESEQTATKLAQLQAEHKNLLERRKGEEQALKKAQRLKEDVLGQVRREQVSLADRLKELKERAARMSGLLKKLESEKPRAYSGSPTQFSGQKGRLPWPAKGPLRVRFGSGVHPELGTQHDSHGIEIGIDGEQPMTAVWKGQVIYANAFKGYGNLMILDHGNKYYTLYAQASRLVKKVGDAVGQGEVVGYSGFEGNRTVYFEIRHRGTPLDPGAWLAPR